MVGKCSARPSEKTVQMSAGTRDLRTVAMMVYLSAVCWVESMVCLRVDLWADWTADWTVDWTAEWMAGC